MALSNPNNVITEQRLKQFYDSILPYLGNGYPTAAGFTPVGTIIAVMGVTAPANYLACNGQIVNIANYKELATYFESQFGSKNYFGGDGTTTFGIPDLRGEFLRGTGTNSHTNQGNGSNVGAHQDASETTILTTTTDGDVIFRFNSSYGVAPANIDKITLKSSQIGRITPTKENFEYSAVGSVRPTNTSVLYCIAVKNIYLNPNLQYNYSTDEQVVGVWTDGKPIYQKTTACTFTETIVDGTGTTQTYPYTQALHIDTLVDMDIVAYFSLAWHKLNVTWIQIIDDESKVYEARAWITLNKELRVRSNSSLFNNCNFNVTLKYTKTTD